MSIRPEQHPEIEVVSENLDQRIRELRTRTGRDIWLYGGGKLFSQVLAWGLVDTIEPAFIPILPGDGIRFLPSPAVRRQLTYVEHRAYPSGMIFIEYAVRNDRQPAE